MRKTIDLLNEVIEMDNEVIEMDIDQKIPTKDFSCNIPQWGI